MKDDARDYRRHGSIIIFIGIVTFIASFWGKIEEVDVVRSLFLLWFGVTLQARSRFVWPKQLEGISKDFKLFQFLLLFCVFIAGYWLAVVAKGITD